MKFKEPSAVLAIGPSSPAALVSGISSANHQQSKPKSSQSSDQRVGALYAIRQARRVNRPQSRRVKQGMDDHASRRDPAIGRDVEARPSLPHIPPTQLPTFWERDSGRCRAARDAIVRIHLGPLFELTGLFGSKLETWTIIETCLKLKYQPAYFLNLSSCPGPSLLHKYGTTICRASTLSNPSTLQCRPLDSKLIAPHIGTMQARADWEDSSVP